MSAEIGAPAPQFELYANDRTTVSNDDLKGRKSLVVFIPFPFTGRCSGELCAIRDGLDALNNLDANVIAITCDTVPTNAHWAEENNFGFRVLSDFWPHGAASRAFGTFNEKLGCAMRSTYVLDAEGVVRDIIATDSLGEAREFDAYVKALEQI